MFSIVSKSFANFSHRSCAVFILFIATLHSIIRNRFDVDVTFLKEENHSVWLCIVFFAPIFEIHSKVKINQVKESQEQEQTE